MKDLSLLQSTILVMGTGNDIDWDKLKDNYDLATLNTLKYKDRQASESLKDDTMVTEMEKNDSSLHNGRRRLGLLSNIYSKFPSNPIFRAGHHMEDDMTENHNHQRKKRTRIRSYRSDYYFSKSKKNSKKKYYDDDYYYDEEEDHSHLHSHGESGLRHSHDHSSHNGPSDRSSQQEECNGGDGEVVVRGGYFYGEGNCPDEGKRGVPCAPKNLGAMCNKFDDASSFRSCFEACKPSFCCIHDAVGNDIAVPCKDDENCPQYAYCYIVWWKLHDTIGPALYLQMEQSDDFFDIEAEEVAGEKSDSPFFQVKQSTEANSFSLFSF